MTWSSKLLTSCRTAAAHTVQSVRPSSSGRRRSLASATARGTLEKAPALTNGDAIARRLAVYEREQQRQKKLVTDVNKIKVEYKDHPDPCSLIMNQNMSTPYDCARHVSKLVGDRAVLAEVDGQLWDMHRPLEADVESLKFLHFKEADPFYVNRAFWRSCSLMLGAVLESAFKKQYYVQLCSFPAPNVRTGSFVYDVDLGVTWQPNRDEMRVLSAEMVKLSMKQLPFERLNVPVEVALDMFADNVYKSSQIPLIANEDKTDEITVYRVGQFVDVSCGPLVSNTSHLGRVTVASAHPIPTGLTDPPTLMRVQGVALPQGILMNHYSYGILEERAMKMNEGRLPDFQAMGMAAS